MESKTAAEAVHIAELGNRFLSGCILTGIEENENERISNLHRVF